MFTPYHGILPTMYVRHYLIEKTVILSRKTDQILPQTQPTRRKYKKNQFYRKNNNNKNIYKSIERLTI